MKIQTESVYFCGVLFAVGIFLQSSMEAIVKWLSIEYSIGQILLFRALFAFPIIGLFVFSCLSKRAQIQVRPNNICLHIVRGGVMALTMIFFFMSLAYMPLADATSLTFLAPIFMVIIGSLVLKEAISNSVIFSTGIAFLGMLLIVKPEFEAIGFISIYPVLSALFYAISMLLTKQLHRTETPESIIIIGNLVVFIIGLILFFATSENFPQPNFLLLGAVGTLGGLATICFVLSLKEAHFSKIGPLEYSSLVWAILFGLIVWSETPNGIVYLGAIFIVIGNLVIFLRNSTSVSMK